MGHPALQTIRDVLLALIGLGCWFASSPDIPVIAVPLMPLAVLAIWIHVVRGVRFVDRHLESGLPLPDDTGQHGIGECLTLLGFILTQAIATVASQIGKPALSHTHWRDLIGLGLLYSAVSVAILGAAIKMLQSTRVKADKVRRTYDAGTITVVKYVLTCGVVIAALLPPLAWFGVLPAQEPPLVVPLTDHHAEVRPVKSRPTEKVVSIAIHISPATGNRELPPALTVKVGFDDDLIRHSWRIIQGDLYDGDLVQDGNRHSAPPAFNDLGTPSGPPVRHFSCTLNELNSTRRYTLVLYLYKPQITLKEAESMVDSLNAHKENLLTIRAEW